MTLRYVSIHTGKLEYPYRETLVSIRRNLRFPTWKLAFPA